MNISLSEVMLILFIALIVIKPEQMPEVAQAIGRFVRFMQGLSAKIKSEMNELMNSSENSDERQR